MPARVIDVPRSTAFGIRTFFKYRGGVSSALAKFAVLRAVKSERDARGLSSLHFAYWALASRATLRRMTPAGHPRPSDARGQMLFFSDFSGDWEVYLAGFNVVLLAALEVVWGSAVSWRRGMTLAQYLAFIKHYELDAVRYYQAYGSDATAHDVRCALALSEQLDRFVVDVEEHVEPSSFAAAYRRFVADVDARL